jgi:hypothetical protein
MQIFSKHASIESIPLKLVIISVITSITVPALWSAYTNYSNLQSENDLKTEIYRIVGAIKQVCLGANGTSLKLEITLKKIEYLKLGDSLDSEYSTVIRCRFKGGGEQIIPISEDAIRVTSNNASLILYSGRYLLVFTHLNYDINGNNKIEDCERYVVVKV